MAAYVVLNNAKSTLATALMIGDTSAAVQSGDGALFAVGSNYSYLVLEDDAGHREVVKITNRSSDALTIVRAQDGTTERDWNIGDIIECRPCRAAYEALKTENATHEATEKTTVVDDDEFPLSDSAASYALKRVKFSTLFAQFRAFIQNGVGAVATDIQTALRRSKSFKDFGAVGDGSTDDTAAIQAAITAHGYIVERESATYKVKDPILVPSNRVIDLGNATITALATDLSAVSTTGNPIFKNSDPSGGNSNITIKGGNLTVTRDAAVRAGALIEFDNVTKGRIADINGTCSGTGLYTTDAGAIYIHDSAHVSVENVKIPSSVGCHNFYVLDSSHVSIKGCDGRDTNDSTFTVNHSPYSEVVGCYAENSAGSHISFNSQHGRVTGNRIMPGARSTSTAIGINIGHATSADYSGSHTVVDGNHVLAVLDLHAIQVQAAVTTKHVTVSNNAVTGDGTGAGNGINNLGEETNIIGNQITGCNYGIRLYGGDSVVSGNTVSECTQTGIRVVSARNTITGNRVFNNGLDGTASDNYGIHCYSSAASDNSITGNVCFDDQGTKTQAIGIVLATGATRNAVVGNMLTGHSTVGFNVNSPGNLYHSNIMDSTNINLSVAAGARFTLDNTGTPSVLNAPSHVITGGTANITSFTNGYLQQEITILADHTVTIKHNISYIKLTGSVDLTLDPDDSVTLVRRSSNLWVETARSVK